MANYINGIAHIVPKKKFKEAFEVIGKIYDLAYDMEIYLEDLFDCLTTHGELLLPEKERKKFARLAEDEETRAYFEKHRVPDDELYDYAYVSSNVEFGRLCNMDADFKTPITIKFEKDFATITFCKKYGDIERVIYDGLELLNILADEVTYYELVGYEGSTGTTKRYIVSVEKDGEDFVEKEIKKEEIPMD